MAGNTDIFKRVKYFIFVYLNLFQHLKVSYHRVITSLIFCIFLISFVRIRTFVAFCSKSKLFVSKQMISFFLKHFSGNQ